MNGAASAAGRTQDVVGRDSERARIDAFVAALHEGPRALAIRGEPGIGKSTLWRYALNRCRQLGLKVLVTRPAEEEMPLALVGLADLFEHVDVDADTFRVGDSPAARGRAVLEALRQLGRGGPTVVAIDDLQWLDSASARALRHAVRRLEDEPIGMLATLRPGSNGADRLGLATALEIGGYQELVLGPLSLSELRAVLAGTVSAISRPTLRKVHEISGGNPLYAIELARNLRDEPQTNGSATGLPLPSSIQSVIAGRLEATPPELEPLLRTVSALGRTSVGALRGALPHVDVDGLLAGAQGHGLLVVEEDLTVRFSHPLLGSGVYGGMTPLERRSLHARLAERAEDPDLRARHLALSSDEPDEAVAAQLEEAAYRAAGHGVPGLAAEFARHSARLTPPQDEESARRRALDEIGHLAAAGEAGRAIELSDRLLAALPSGPGRAEVIIERTTLMCDDLDRIESLLEQALDDVRDDDALRGLVLTLIGWVRGIFRGDVYAGLRSLREAEAVSGQIADLRLEMFVASRLAILGSLAGAPRPDLMDKAVAISKELGAPRLFGGPRVWNAKMLLWAGDIPSARAVFEEMRDGYARSGSEFQRPNRLYDLALVECAAGNFATADGLVREGLEAARDAGSTGIEGWLLYALALVEMWQGRAVEARQATRQLIERAETRGERPLLVRARNVLGSLALSENDPEEAARELTEASRLLEELGLAHPGAYPVLPDEIEALAGSGDLARAEVELERLQVQAAALDSEWALAAADRSRGVVLLARGDAEEAASALQHSTGAFDELGFRPDASRALLARGRALLRGGHRSLAAETLAGAQRRFGAMGARLWEARATDELHRAASSRTSGTLTPTERRIAALVATGMRNREIAPSLFMSEATVEAHLTRIYRKLDIGSRSELTRLVTEGALPLAPDDGPRPRSR